MSNSSLATYSVNCPYKTSPRNHIIDTITIHCYCGQVTVERGCDGFKSRPAGKEASCNYVVAKDGKVGLVVDEKDRSWCSSNATNDNRAITIEVASDNYAPYAITDAAMKGLINLCADICKRNNIKQLVWSTNKNTRVKHLNGANMTCHRDFASKACPGDYIYAREGYIADEVNKLLGVSTPTPAPSTSNTTSSYNYNGVDYAPVFDYLYYASKYPDLKTAFGTDKTKLFNHFCQYGMKERRQGCANFNVEVYAKNYADLQAAFGSDWPSYYKHYCQYGKKEGRKAI